MSWNIRWLLPNLYRLAHLFRLKRKNDSETAGVRWKPTEYFITKFTQPKEDRRNS